MKIKPFDTKKIPSKGNILIIGSSCAGKSWLIKDLLHAKRDTPLGVVFSGGDKIYEDFIPRCLIKPKYEPEILSQLFTRQAVAISKGCSPRLFTVFDEWNDVWKSAIFKEMIINGRYYKMLSITSMPCPEKIPPDLRTHLDYVFIFKHNFQYNRELIYKYYAGMFPTLEIFWQVFDSCTEDHGCLVIDNTSTSNKLEDQVFWYKASKHDDFKMCSEKLWKMNVDAA